MKLEENDQLAAAAKIVVEEEGKQLAAAAKVVVEEEDEIGNRGLL